MVALNRLHAYSNRQGSILDLFIRAGVKSGNFRHEHLVPLFQGTKIMDAINNEVAQLKTATNPSRPSRAEAEAAVRTLLAWAGDDPTREGLIETPSRVIKAFGEWFSGYQGNPQKELSRTFDEVNGYDDMVMLRGIEVQSHCEHHMAPFIGKAYVAYLPSGKVVGLSKIARVVEIFAKRLQTQETLTAQIAKAITASVGAKGVAVMIDAEHQCMSTRGINHKDVGTITTSFTNQFKESSELRQRFLALAEK